MIRIRRSEDRGQADRGWLQARYTFSFGTYQDPDYMGFRVLRVLNDDLIAAGHGFGPHAHRDMEIITFVVEGRIRHRDSMGASHVIRPNEIQVMSAGNGVVHSEFNASDEESARVIQIWIEPASEDLHPSYQQIAINPLERRGQWQLLAAPIGGDHAATTINQDARVYVAEAPSGSVIRYAIAPQRSAWVQVVRGHVVLNGDPMKEGDGAAISNEPEIVVAGDIKGGELLLFDLP
jgi:redox-sensitive bicupin YhaK (pirin superfamily)